MEIMFTLAQAKTDCTLTPKKQGNHTFLIISVIENASMHVWVQFWWVDWFFIDQPDKTSEKSSQAGDVTTISKTDIL